MSAGAYRIRSGSEFYIGSSTDLAKRKRDHSWRLRNGTHPVKELQAEFDKVGEAEFIVTDYLRISPGEDDKDFRDRLFKAEQSRINEVLLSGEEGMVNRSWDSRGPQNCNVFRDLWKDPVWRDLVFSDEVREKMSSAKRGDRNARSRSVIVTTPKGDLIRMSCGRDAAKYFGQSQQSMDLWLRGKMKWPGQGRRPRLKTLWMRDYSAVFEAEFAGDLSGVQEWDGSSPVVRPLIVFNLE